MKWLLDTNVISEVRKRVPDRRVEFWLSIQEEESLFLSVITIGQIRYGVEALRQRDASQAAAIERWWEKVKTAHADRILPITEEIAETWGRLSPSHPLPLDDGLIAATALQHGMTVVTRNVADFERSGVQIYNPFLG